MLTNATNADECRIGDIEDETGTRVIISRTEPVVIVEGSRSRREKARPLRMHVRLECMSSVVLKYYYNSQISCTKALQISGLGPHTSANGCDG